MYSEGQREAVAGLYGALYERGHITHWAVDSPRTAAVRTRSANDLTNMSAPGELALLVDKETGGQAALEVGQQLQYKHLQFGSRKLLMDLHGFSRGMAYAALHVAIKEVR